jgi:hypothetical protein
MPDSVAAPAAAAASSEVFEVIDPLAGVDADTAAEQADASEVEAPAEKKPAADKKPAPEKPQPRKLKLSETEEIDEEEAVKTLQKRRQLDRGAFKKFEEAKALRDEVAQKLEALKQNPWAALEKAGIDPVRAAYELLQRQVEAAQMSPEQRAILERENALSEREARINQHEEQQTSAERQRASTAFEQKAVSNMTAALDKSGLPKHPLTLAMMSQHAMAQYRAHGGESDPDFEPDYDYAASEAGEMARDFARAWLGTLAKNPQALVKEFPEVEKAIRQFHLASARKPPVPGKVPAAAPRKNGEPEKPINLNDMVRDLMHRSA